MPERIPLSPARFPHPPLPAHALLDAGEGEKLERFGELVLVRPDPQALGRRRLPAADWQQADLVFVRESDRGGRWEGPGAARRGARRGLPGWEVEVGGTRLFLRATPFKHVGLFPEQAANWLWIEERRAALGADEPRLLDLFGYTGVASVLAARAGWRVTLVDASKTAVAWARENAALAGVEPARLRFLVDDALAFARREARRGARYEGILLDPPHYGRGPKGEKWQFETGIVPLLEASSALLAERAFLILSTYAMGTSPLALANLLGSLGDGTVEAGELALPVAGGGPPRYLPCGFCARWWREGGLTRSSSGGACSRGRPAPGGAP
ncbi:MAG: class I SAM-dependent methyltransferase [Planctomycetota bacterium]